MGYADISPLNFENIVLLDHIGPVTQDPPNNGQVKIYALVALPMPYFVLDPATVTLGPDPSIGDEFDVNVTLTGLPPTGLHFAWYTIGWQLRLFYDDKLLDVAYVKEGPFLKDGPWNLHGTFFTAWFPEDDLYGTHVLAGGMLMPNGTGYWDMETWPNGTGVIMTVRFKAIYQSYPHINETTLYMESVFGNWLIDKDGGWIPVDESKNGVCEYTMTTNLPGRMIDVCGGAVNRGYGVTYGVPSAFPAPYGGQGPNGNMDLVIPQSVVYLLADVTYNYWPVQSKDVGFEIQGPYDQETGQPRYTFFIRKYSSRTDSEGIAWIKFQMPWPCPGELGPNGEPCERPEDLFGKYKVTATVDICGVVVNDTLWFDYYYLVEITKVSVDRSGAPPEYAHEEYVKVKVDFRSKAQQEYPALFSVVIQDELETAFGSALYSMNVSGAEFCHWKTYTFTVSIFIPKWAFAGIAKIYVSAFDIDPTEGGAPWCPTYTPLPTICIQPW
jgi:hypothetical protein